MFVMNFFIVLILNFISKNVKALLVSSKASLLQWTLILKQLQVIIPFFRGLKQLQVIIPFFCGLKQLQVIIPFFRGLKQLQVIIPFFCGLKQLQVIVPFFCGFIFLLLFKILIYTLCFC